MSDQGRAKLCEYEVQILREVAGDLPASPWGAAVGACLEHLRGYGYTDAAGITEKGREYLRRMDGSA